MWDRRKFRQDASAMRWRRKRGKRPAGSSRRSTPSARNKNMAKRQTALQVGATETRGKVVFLYPLPPPSPPPPLSLPLSPHRPLYLNESIIITKKSAETLSINSIGDRSGESSPDGDKYLLASQAALSSILFYWKKKKKKKKKKWGGGGGGGRRRRRRRRRKIQIQNEMHSAVEYELINRIIVGEGVVLERWQSGVGSWPLSAPLDPV